MWVLMHDNLDIGLEDYHVDCFLDFHRYDRSLRSFFHHRDICRIHTGYRHNLLHAITLIYELDFLMIPM
jgi:hypothetical protein